MTRKDALRRRENSAAMNTKATGGAAGVRLFPTGTTTRLTRCATAERRICGIFVCDKKGEGKFVYHRDGAAAGKTGGREKVE